MRRNGLWIAGLAVGLALGLATNARAEPLTIRVGWVVTPGHLTPLIEALGKRQPGLFKHLGKSYVLQAVHFQGTTPEIQAQAINELEIASFSTAAIALAITNAHLDERIVADVVADGIPGHFSEYFVVRADGPIKTVEDVKGKRIATNTIGSASDAAMRTMFRVRSMATCRLPLSSVVRGKPWRRSEVQMCRPPCGPQMRGTFAPATISW